MSNHGSPAKNGTRASLAIEFLYAHPLKTTKGGAPGLAKTGLDRGTLQFHVKISDYSTANRPVTAPTRPVRFSRAANLT